MPEGIFDVPILVGVAFLAWLAIRLSRALRSRDVDYSRAMQADMAEREQQAEVESQPTSAGRRR